MQFHGRTVLNPAAFLRQRLPVIALAAALLLAPDARAAETVPPLTTPSPIMGTYATPQSVTLTCSDGGGSGCAATYYCLGTGCTPTTPYSGPVSISSTSSLSFYTTDLDGNSEQVRTYAYTIDPSLSYHFKRIWPQLSQPWYFKNVSGVAADSSGNVYVADTDNNRIQKFDVNGAFVTGWGEYGSNNGQFKYPYGIAVDQDGYVYVADKSNNRVQKFAANGTFVVAWGASGNGPAQFNSPAGIAVDSAGNIYVADTYNHRVQKFTADGTFVVAWGSAGSGTGQFASLAGIAADSFGNIYVADTNNSRVQKFDSNGGFLAAFGSYGSTNGKFNYPRSITVDSSGNVYVADTSNKRIQKFDSTGTYISAWGSYGSGVGQLNDPYGISVDSFGNIYVAENNNKRIQKFDSSGNALGIWTASGSSDGTFNYPQSCAVDAGGTVYVTDYYNHRVQKFTASGSFLTSIGTYGTGNGQFSGPKGVALDSAGNLYVADAARIQKFSSGGVFVTAWGAPGTGNGEFGAGGLAGIAVEPAGNIYVIDSNNHRIQKFDANGTFLTKWGSNGSGAGQFSYPSSIAIDANGYLYVADTYNSRIQKFDSIGNFVLSWGSTQSSDLGKFRLPEGVAVDASGNVYVSDTNNHRIQKFTGSGTFLTAWGTVLFANSSGAGIFSSPKGLALDTVGNVYVVDTGNHRIQKFAPLNLPESPGAPTGVTAVAGYGQATVSFSPPSFDGGSAITSYTVTSSPGNITAFGSASPITVTGLANATGYSFTVVATNAGGIGPASIPSNTITPNPIYSLSLTVNGSGTVHSTPAPDINCTGSCGRSYPGDTEVSLTASPSSGYTFMGWSGGCSGIDICTVTMNQAQAVGALFVFTGINGVCGPAHNGNYALAPDAGLCANGTQSAVTGIGPWSWTCAGSGGGATASCSATQAGGIVHRSGDGGSTWTPGMTGLGFNNPTNAILPSPSHASDQTLLLGANNGIYRSSDRGDSWTQVLTTDMVNALAASPAFASDHTLFAGAYLSGFYKSTDSGTTWTQSNTGLDTTMIFSLAVSPAFASDRTIYAGLYSKGVYKSTDGGATWNAVNAGISTVHGKSLAISPTYVTDQTVFVVTSDNHVYKSVNAGVTWSLSDTGVAGTPALVAISPAYATDQTLFAATSNGIFKSSNRGGSWIQVSTLTSVNGLVVSPSFASDQTVVASAYGDNIYRSSNGGSSWSPSDSSFTVGRKQFVALALSPAFASDHAVFAATYLAGPYSLVTPSSLSFGSVTVNSSSTIQQVTITNGNGMFGDANLAVTGMTLTGTGAGQFSLSPGTCGTLTPVLPVGTSCSVDVTFIPASTGSKSASLQITTNDVSSQPLPVSLSGTGVSLSSAITSPASGTYANGTSVAVSGSASCTGGCTVSKVEVSADGGATWLTASGTTSWSISVPTAAAGTYTIRSRATTSGSVETPATGITVTVERTPPGGTLALYYGVWTLNAAANDGGMCVQVYPSICGTVEMSFDGANWQPATTTPGTGGPLWLRDRAGNISAMIAGALANDNGGLIRMEGGYATYYSFLQHALNAAGNGNVLKLTASRYNESLLANASTAYTVRGGYDNSHNSITGTTQLSGTLNVQAGTVTVENLEVTGSMTVEGGEVTANSITIL